MVIGKTALIDQQRVSKTVVKTFKGTRQVGRRAQRPTLQVDQRMLNSVQGDLNVAFGRGKAFMAIDTTTIRDPNYNLKRASSGRFWGAGDVDDYTGTGTGNDEWDPDLRRIHL